MLLLAALAHAVTLEEAWSAADRHDTDLALVHENTVQTGTLQGQAFALLSPKLVLGGHYTYNEYEIAWDPSTMIPEEFQELLGDQDPIVFQKQSYFDGNISVVQPLFSGQAVPLYQAAVATVKASRFDEAGIRTQLKSGVAKVYYGLAVAREGEQVAQNALENAHQHVAIVEQQLAAGTAPPTAKLQAEIALSRAQRGVAEAHEGVVKAGEAFAKMTGLPADSAVELPTAPTLPYATPDAAIDRAVSHRPELSAAELRYTAARRGSVASALSWFPTVDGRFTYSWTQNNVGFNTDPTFWQVVLTADWVLWDGGARLAENKKYASQARQAQLAETKVEEDTRESIRTLWSTHAKATASFETAHHEVTLAEENLRIAEVAFKAGGITFMELEDARLGVLASRTGELSEQMQRDLSAYDLLAATGDL